MSAPLPVPAALLRCLLASVLALAAALGPAVARADGGAALERSVKAAFLYKFLGYAEFPANAFSDAAAPVVIGVVGSEEMAGELARIVAGRTIGVRPIVVRQVREGEHAGVHLLFVAGADCGRAARVLRQPGAPMLPVTECGSGLQAGSIINFKIVDEHVRFDVSLDAADKNNIRLSSRLLTVANHVSKGAP